MKRKRSAIIIILMGLLTSLIGLLGNLVSGAISSAVIPYAWPLLGVVLLIGIGLAVWEYRLTVNQDRLGSPVPILSRENRQRMLARVRDFWIAGFLEKSLRGAALIDLGLEERQDVLANPWQLVFQQADKPARALPAGTHVVQVYDEAGGELLILGEPGSGKTTLLLELTQVLLDRAGRDENHPIPVVFNLSSWATKRQPIVDWLVEELNLKYQVSRVLGHAWVSTDQIIPLLDGLDEVSLAYRESCIEAINNYHQEHMVPIVVCSRRSDYVTSTKRILIRYAIAIQPLTIEQVNSYLESLGERTVINLLRVDPVLQELAVTPLMLNLLTLTFRVMPVEGFLTTGVPTIQTRRRQLFASYVQSALKRGWFEPRYTTQMTIRWLAWLAQQMVRFSQTEFYIERMQPDWLPTGSLRNLYHYITGMVVGGGIMGLASGLLGGLIGGLVSGLLGGLIGGLISGLMGGLAGALLSWLSYKRDRSIEPLEMLSFSWSHLQRNLWRPLLGGLAVGIGYGLLSGFFFGLLKGLFFGLLAALVIALFLSLLSGLTYEMMDPHNFVRPNEGIRRSARNSLIASLCSGAVLGCLIGLFLGLLKGLGIGLFSGLFVGLLIGLLVSLFSGGRALIEHFVLRLLLWYAGYIPWKYSDFLDYAASRILLSKVGGGYTFVHRLLLEYFSTLDTVSAPFERTRQAKNVRKITMNDPV